MPIIKKYKSEIINIQNPLPDIFVAIFRSLEKNYTYKPGQYLHIALDEYNPSLPWPDSRCFSMQSSPSTEEIKITFSVKGNFTKRMAIELQKNKQVYLKLPYGDFLTRPYQKNNCIFIAGGTGITPFLSLFTDTVFAEYINPKLYFGVRNKDYNLYDAGIEKAKSINTSFSASIFHENKQGVLDINKIFEIQDQDAIYFISGPPVMIKNFKEFLINNSIEPKNIVTDDWE